MTTGYVYDPLYLAHNLPGHPEHAGRLQRIMTVLEERGMLSRLTAIAPRPATVEELQRVHTRGHIDNVRSMSERGGGHLDPDTYVNASSYQAACVAAGGLLAAVEALLDGRIDNGFALLRPPGHHALSNRAMGFCLFNNVAVAARHALTLAGVERVWIADFDVHHGNGTQAMFERDPDVYYFSTHQYPFYPGSGHWQEVGGGAGAGTVLDVPLPAGAGDAGMGRVYAELVWPLVRRFRPALILVSAGYDAHWQDPLAAMQLSLAGYAALADELVEMARQLCGGRILFVLEGGYHLDVLAYGVLNTFYALLGDPTRVDPLGAARRGEPDITSLLQALKALHHL